MRVVLQKSFFLVNSKSKCRLNAYENRLSFFFPHVVGFWYQTEINLTVATVVDVGRPRTGQTGSWTRVGLRATVNLSSVITGRETYRDPGSKKSFWGAIERALEIHQIAHRQLRFLITPSNKNQQQPGGTIV